MILSDTLKNAINELQTRIVPCYESDNVLLIFDKQEQIDRYKKFIDYITPDRICITLKDLCESNKLRGTRFKRFMFVTDSVLNDLIRED